MGRKSIQIAKKQEILTHFRQAIIEDGLEGATTGNVARRMEIRTSHLMHYFPSKESMIRAMISQLVSTYEEKFSSTLETHEDPKERLHFILRQLLSPNWEDADQSKLFYTCYSLIFRNEGIKEEFQKLFSVFRQFLIQELRYAMEHQVIVDQPEEEIADLIITLVEGKGIYHQIVDDSAWAEKQNSRLFMWIWGILTKSITKFASTNS